MNHFATPEFWTCYQQLPPDVRKLADKSFTLLNDPLHPTLRFKKIGHLYSARVGLHYRALAKARKDGLIWFWIGPHGEYDKILT